METLWLALALALSLFIPPLFFSTNNEISFTFIINHNNQTLVFNYLSNPENFAVLNPTIYKMETISGKGNEFYVKYEECLSHFPIVTNSGFAHYKIKERQGGSHEMYSSHSTCFMGKFLCLPTYSSIRIKVHDLSRTAYEEDIKYVCPWVLRIFCTEEILFQRMAIMNHLDQLFSEDQF